MLAGFESIIKVGGVDYLLVFEEYQHFPIIRAKAVDGTRRGMGLDLRTDNYWRVFSEFMRQRKDLMDRERPGWEFLKGCYITKDGKKAYRPYYPTMIG